MKQEILNKIKIMKNRIYNKQLNDVDGFLCILDNELNEIKQFLQAEKPESAWDMANRLLEIINKLSFDEQEYYIVKFPYAKKYKEQDAIKIMQEIEKELKNE